MKIKNIFLFFVFAIIGICANAQCIDCLSTTNANGCDRSWPNTECLDYNPSLDAGDSGRYCFRFMLPLAPDSIGGMEVWEPTFSQDSCSGYPISYLRYWLYDDSCNVIANDVNILPFNTNNHMYIGLIPGNYYRMCYAFRIRPNANATCRIKQFCPLFYASPLPIVLTYFYGHVIKNETILYWQTSSEINNDLFTIQQSVNGKDFYDIGNVNGNGNSTNIINYTFSVNNESSENVSIYYYRLKQTDYDGHYSFSNTIYMEIKKSNKLMKIEIRDLYGKSYEYNSMNMLSNGIYVVSYFFENGTIENKKIILVKPTFY